MKFRPTLLLCAVVFTVALPIWAGRVPYTGTADEFPNTEISATVTRSPGTTLKAPAEPASGMVLTNSFETNNALDARDLKPSSILDTFFTSSSDADAQTARLSDHHSVERASSISHAEKAWHAERTEYGEGRTRDHERKRGLVPVLVPEPGSLSLLLLGLAAVGFLARRRGDLPTAA
jgi:hypothetical protein